MPQTKFVVGKALKIGLKPIVCINKVDKPDARANEVINEVFDLFAALDATDEQLGFPIIYGSASRAGWPDNAGRSAGSGHGAAVRPRRSACRRAEGGGRRVPDASEPARSQSISGPHHHGSRFLGIGEAQTNR